MVEIFKTNVEKIKHSKMLIMRLKDSFPEYKINFDLSDCDRILRVEGENIGSDAIIQILNLCGFYCEILK